MHPSSNPNGSASANGGPNLPLPFASTSSAPGSMSFQERMQWVDRQVEEPRPASQPAPGHLYDAHQHQRLDDLAAAAAAAAPSKKRSLPIDQARLQIMRGTYRPCASRRRVINYCNGCSYVVLDFYAKVTNPTKDQYEALLAQIHVGLLFFVLPYFLTWVSLFFVFVFTLALLRPLSLPSLVRSPSRRILTRPRITGPPRQK
jgi:hypothetical protein